MAKLIDDSDGRIPPTATFKVISGSGVSPVVESLAQKCSDALLGRKYTSIADLTKDISEIPGNNEVRIIGSSTYGYFLGVLRSHRDSDKDLYHDLGLELEVQY